MTISVLRLAPHFFRAGNWPVGYDPVGGMQNQVWQLARVSDRLRIPVMCFGLRTDFQGKLFPGSSELLAVADVLREIRTICACGAKATMVVRQNAEGRVITDGEQVAIEKSVYVSLCRRHWEEAVGRWPVKGP